MFPAIPAIAAAIPAGAIAAAKGAAAPLAAALGLGIAIANSGSSSDSVFETLKGPPDVAAECIQRNAIMQRNLAANARPLSGNDAYAVIVQEGFVGEPQIMVLIQKSEKGSSAEFRPVTADPRHAQTIAKLSGGC